MQGLRGRMGRSQLLASSGETCHHTLSKSPCPDSKFKKTLMTMGKSLSLSMVPSIKMSIRLVVAVIQSALTSWQSVSDLVLEE